MFLNKLYSINQKSYIECIKQYYINRSLRQDIDMDYYNNILIAFKPVLNKERSLNSQDPNIIFTDQKNIHNDVMTEIINNI